MGYFPFVAPGEKTVFTAPGILENTVSGLLILTHPFIAGAILKEGLLYSTLTVSSKKESLAIQKMNKKGAREFHSILTEIIKKNKK